MYEIKILQENVVVDSQKETENAMYNIRYQYSIIDGEKQLLAVNVSVAEKVSADDGTSYNGIGDMMYNSDQISMSGFPYSAKTTTYVDEFAEIVEEIKNIINGDKKAPSL